MLYRATPLPGSRIQPAKPPTSRLGRNTMPRIPLHLPLWECLFLPLPHIETLYQRSASAPSPSTASLALLKPRSLRSLGAFPLLFDSSHGRVRFRSPELFPGRPSNPWPVLLPLSFLFSGFSYGFSPPGLRLYPRAIVITGTQLRSLPALRLLPCSSIPSPWQI